MLAHPCDGAQQEFGSHPTTVLCLAMGHNKNSESSSTTVLTYISTSIGTSGNRSKRCCTVLPSMCDLVPFPCGATPSIGNVLRLQKVDAI